MAAEGFRVLSEVNGDVKNLSLDDGYELRLGEISLLEVEAADNSSRRGTLVILDKFDIETREVLEGLAVVSFKEITATISEDFRLEDKESVDIGSYQFHLSIFFR